MERFAIEQNEGIVMETNRMKYESLGNQTLHLLRIHAVYGLEAPVDSLSRLSGMPAYLVYEHVEKLVEAGILKVSSDGLSSFLSNSLRLQLSEHMSIRERMTLHDRCAADLISQHANVVAVAEHLASGTPTNEVSKLDYLISAARDELYKGAPVAALRYLRAAVNWTTDDKLRILLMIDLGLAQAASGDPGAVERLETALRVIGDETEQQRALHALAMTLYRYGRHQDAAKLFRSGLRNTGALETTSFDFRGGFICAAQYLPELRGELLEALDDHLYLTSKFPSSREEFTLLSNIALANAMSIGKYRAPDVADFADKALSSYAIPGGDTPADLSVLLAILALLWAGKPLRADAYINTVLEYAVANGSRLLISESAMVKSLVTYQLGDLDETIKYAERSIEGIEEGWGSGLPVPHSVLAQCYLDKGRFVEAAKLLEDMNARVMDNAVRGMNAWYFLARGRVRMATSDPSGALSDFKCAGEVFDEYLNPTSPALLPWRSYAATAYIALDDPKAADRLASEELDLALRADLPIQVGVALRARGLAKKTEPEQISSLRDSLAVLEKTPARLEILWSKLELGRALITDGGLREEGRSLLIETINEASKMHCTYAGQKAREALSQVQDGFVNESKSRVSLTNAEAKVLELFGREDYDTQRISVTLFLSPHTVEWHLKRITKKLGFRTRHELRQFIRGTSNEVPAR